MNIWLDDERDPKDHGWGGALWFCSGEALVTYLTDHDMSCMSMSLDHDLGDHASTKIMTGYDVMCWIEERVRAGSSAPRSIAIHTQNPVGRARMRAARFSIYQIEETR